MSIKSITIPSCPLNRPIESYRNPRYSLIDPVDIEIVLLILVIFKFLIDLFSCENDTILIFSLLVSVSVMESKNRSTVCSKRELPVVVENQRFRASRDKWIYGVDAVRMDGERKWFLSYSINVLHPFLVTAQFK